MKMTKRLRATSTLWVCTVVTTAGVVPVKASSLIFPRKKKINLAKMETRFRYPG